MPTTGPSSKRFRDTEAESARGNSCVCHGGDSKDDEYETIHVYLKGQIH